MTLEQVRLQLKPMTTTFGGAEVPKVDTFPDIDVAELEAGDDDPMYITLQIAEEGIVSKDGLISDDDLVETIERQIFEKRVDGLMGHLDDDERFMFPVTDMGSKPLGGIWVGTKRVNKTLWGKAYILPGKVRQYFATKKASKGKISTSIYGMAVVERYEDGTRRFREFDLETLDFAPADRAAMPFRGEFAVSAQIAGDEPGIVEIEKEGVMPEDNKQVTLADVPDAVRQQIIQQFSEKADLEGKAKRVTELEVQMKTLGDEKAKLEETVAQMRQYAAVVSEICTTLGEDADVVAVVRQMHEVLSQVSQIAGVEWTDLTVRIEEMHVTVAEMAKTQFEHTLEAEIAKVTDWNVTSDEGKAKLGALRRNLSRAAVVQMGDALSVEGVAAAVKAAWEDPDFQVLAEMTRQSLAGPAALIAGQDRAGKLPDNWEDSVREKFKVGGRRN